MLVRERLVDLAWAVTAFVVDGWLLSGGGTTAWGDRLAPGVLMSLGAVVAATLLVRRRHPLLVFAAWWANGLLPLMLPGSEPVVGLLVSLFTVAARTGERASLLALGAAAVPLGINAVHTVVLQPEKPVRLALSILEAGLVWLLLGAASWSAGWLVHTAAERAARREEEYVAETEALLRANRLELARELHDIVSHSVSAMLLQAAGLRASTPGLKAELRTGLQAIEDSGMQAMRDLHRMLGLLREVNGHGEPRAATQGRTLSELEGLVAATRRCNVAVEVVVEGEPRPLPPPLAHTAYQVVQECLANVVRHGGVGSRCEVGLHWFPSELEVTVSNTVGSHPLGRRLHGGFGLRGLAERVSAVGGTFQAAPAPPAGFAVTAVIPLVETLPPAVPGERRT